MGNTGLNRFWEAPASPFHEENEQLSSEDATEEETSSGSSEYRYLAS